MLYYAMIWKWSSFYSACSSYHAIKTWIYLNFYELHTFRREVVTNEISKVSSGGSVAQWSELGFECGKTRVQIPDSDYWMNLSSAIPGANSPRFVNSQLVCLQPVGILNWGFKHDDWKTPLGELSLGIHIYFFHLIYFIYFIPRRS